MSWAPLSLDELKALLAHELDACSADQRALFERCAIGPTKWALHPWGDEGGGFWVVAVDGTRVLWFNDIEEGFNVSTFVVAGTIPDDQYFCTQDELTYALRLFAGDAGGGRS